MKIYIIDDDKTFGFFLGRRLQNLGYDTIYMPDLKELDEKNIDLFSLFIVDIHLGKEDGLEGIKFLKKKGYNILVATGETNQNTLSCVKKIGVLDIMFKPFTGEHIHQKLLSIFKPKR